MQDSHVKSNVRRHASRPQNAAIQVMHLFEDTLCGVLHDKQHKCVCVCVCVQIDVKAD